jgi:Domain of unknown function (DUF4350)
MTRPTLAARLRTPRVIVPALLVLLGGFGALWFLQTHERKAYEEYQWGSPAARENPLLAAEGYLQALGQESSSRKGMEFFSALPSTGDAILLRRMPAGMGRNLTDNLFAWVEAGGHLLLVPSRASSNHPGADDILKRVGAQLQEESSKNCGCPDKNDGKTDAKPKGVSEPDEENPTEPDSSGKNKVDEGYHPYTSFLDLNVDGFPVRLEYFKGTLLDDITQSATFRIDGSYRMEYEEEADRQRKSHNKMVKKDGAWLLQYKVGAGTMTVMSEMLLFNNWSIGEYDHAFFLSWLVRDADRVWLLYATRTDSLGSILWNRLPYFWLSLAVLTVLALWRMQKRSGGLLRPQFDSRRNILAHIDATGLYSWRMDNGSCMIAENRKTMLQRLARQIPGLRQGREEQAINISTLAAKIGATEHELMEVFRSKVVSEQDLIRTSRGLQKIEALIHNGEQARNER